MVLDASIPLQGRVAQVQAPDLGGALLTLSSLRRQRQQERLTDLQVEQANREAESQRRLRDVFARNPQALSDPAQQQVALSELAQVNPQAAFQFQGQILQQRKAEREAQKAEIENHVKRIEIVSRLAGSVQDQASYDQARQIFQEQFPDVPINLPAVYDPNLIQRLQLMGLDAGEQLKARHQQLTLEEQQEARLSRERIAGQDRQSREGIAAANRASEDQRAEAARAAQIRGQDIAAATSRRGQDISAATQRETAKINANALGRIVETSTGFVGVNPKTGAVEPIIDPSGQQLQPKPTDGQAQAAGFGRRAAEAHALAAGLEQQGVGQQNALEKAASGLPIVGNYLTPESQQRYNQAKLDFITAVLRKESGAAIADSEFRNEERKYFPQPGDGPRVLEQKRKARERALDNLAEQSGPALRSRVAPQRSGNAPANDPLGIR